MQVSIPQAVSTVATNLHISVGIESVSVSIPQAVSTVATYKNAYMRSKSIRVSIPQAVSTVATKFNTAPPGAMIFTSFNTASGKHCCNINKNIEQ